MNQTAEVINFERPVVKADIEQGFDRVAGRLTDTLMNPPVSISGREFQVIHAVISKTYRYHKKADWISSAQLSEMTGIDYSNISKIKTSLLNKKILVKNGREIGVNPIVSEWQQPEIVKNDYVKNSQKRLIKKSNTTNEQSKTTKNLVENDCNNRKTIQQKNTTHKTIENLPLPNGLSKLSWSEFIQHRKEIKKPMTELAATKFLKRIEQQIASGFDPSKLIDDAIANGWQTTYPPKQSGFQSNNKAQPENFSEKDYGQSTFTGDFL